VSGFLAVIATGAFGSACSNSGLPPIGQTIAWSGTVTDLSSMMGVGSLKLCQTLPAVASPPCTMTAADGTFTLNISAHSDVAVELTGSGYLPVLIEGTSGTSDFANYNATALTTSEANLLVEAVGQQLDNTKGQVAIRLTNASAMDGGSAAADGGLSGPQAGATVTISPSSVSGAYYFDNAGIPQTTQSSTSDNGIATFINVDPGDVTLEITPAPGITCTPLTGWDITGNTLKVHVEAGHGVGVSAACQ
jgi:hypothetical protein